MSRIICITGHFPILRNGIPTGKTEFVVSHGVDEDSGRNVCLPCEPPHLLGARFERDHGEWVLDDAIAAH